MTTDTRPTQATRILAILRDGEWHSTAALFDRTRITRVPARIHELRRDGYAIEVERRRGPGGAMWAYYRLVIEPQGRLW